MAEHPAALQLRLLQTVVEVAAEKNSTLVLPFPVELLRFLERATPADVANTESRTPRSRTPTFATRRCECRIADADIRTRRAHADVPKADVSDPTSRTPRRSPSRPRDPSRPTLHRLQPKRRAGPVFGTTARPRTRRCPSRSDRGRLGGGAER